MPENATCGGGGFGPFCFKGGEDEIAQKQTGDRLGRPLSIDKNPKPGITKDIGFIKVNFRKKMGGLYEAAPGWKESISRR
jgi:hypothetical protein